MKPDLKRNAFILFVPMLLVGAVSACFLLLCPTVLKPDSHMIPLFLTIILIALLVELIHILALRRGKRGRIQQEVSLNTAVTVDSLTGLLNKSGFEAEARRILDSALPESRCAIVNFEVVAFRAYNYLYSFEAGNELIKDIADIARESIGEGGVAARLYADHFVMLVMGADEEEIYDCLRNGVKELKRTGIRISLCGGIYLVSDRQVPVHSMIDRAIVAKDAVKYKFGSGVAIYDDSMLSYQMEDADLLGSMLQTDSPGKFVAYYQPKYGVGTETIKGAEALVRWMKPNGEIISPGHFIELFEKTGFIRKLDFQIFEETCKMLGEALAAGSPVVPVSVNFSRVHMYDQHFPKKVHDIAEKYNVDPKFLEIELTESAFFMKAEDIILVVDRLHEYGFSVAIDDFGSGFSSLNMLKDISVDVLKIDMKFLEGFEHGGKVGTVVTSVIRMAKWLGIPVVAEGVETKEQVDFLRTLGCDMIQGYYYSKPLSQREYEALLIRKDVLIRPFAEKPAVITLDGINAALGGDGLITSLADAIFGGVGLYELDGDRLEAIRVNNAYLELMGYPDMAAFDAHSQNVLSQFYPVDAEKLLIDCKEATITGEVQKTFIRRYDYLGKLRTFSGLLKHIGGTEERPLFCMTFIDVTEKERAEKEKELNKYGDALASIYDEIWEFNQMTDTLRILYANNKKKQGKELKFGGASVSWLKNRIHPDDLAAVSKMMSLVREGRLENLTKLEYRIFDKGEVRWMASSVIPVAGGSCLLCNLDITDKKQVEQIVAKLGNINRKLIFDEVSGLLSRETAEELILERLETEKTGRAAALMLIRINNFKAINEKIGNEATNAFIKEAANKIKSKFRDHDIIGRIDEDEFAVYMSNFEDSSTVKAKAEKVLATVNEIEINGLTAECSIGFSIMTSDEKDLYKAFNKAIEALNIA